jgi:N-formylglutamate deformylase
MDEPPGLLTSATWPTPYDETRAAPMRATLTRVLQACLDFANR